MCFERLDLEWQSSDEKHSNAFELNEIKIRVMKKIFSGKNLASFCTLQKLEFSKATVNYLESTEVFVKML